MRGFSRKLKSLFHTFLVLSILLLSAVAAWPEDPLPVLTLDQAVQIAIANNRSLKVSSLDIEKSKWELASTKTHRLPSFTTAMFASGNLTSPTFTFKKGIFGPSGGGVLPTEDVHIPLSNGITGYALAQVAQP